MFTVGEAYDIELIEGSDDHGQPLITTYSGRFVQDATGPLIKINNGKGHMVINTGSPAFFRAVFNGK